MIVATPPCTRSCHVLPTNLCAPPSRDVGRGYQQRLHLRLNAHCAFSSSAKLRQKKIFIWGFKTLGEFMTDRQRHTLTSQSSSPSWRTLTTRSDSDSDGNTNIEHKHITRRKSPKLLTIKAVVEDHTRRSVRRVRKQGGFGERRARRAVWGLGEIRQHSESISSTWLPWPYHHHNVPHQTHHIDR
jgi:hypothetical protein